MLKREVYDSKEFAEYAKENLVLVRADFPRRIRQSTPLRRANAELKAKYATPFQGYPTAVILDGKGKKLGEIGGFLPKKHFISDIEKAVKK